MSIQTNWRVTMIEDSKQKVIIQQDILEMTVNEFKEALTEEWSDGIAEKTIDAIIADLVDARISMIARFGE